jgi:hypothetical protein
MYVFQVKVIVHVDQAKFVDFLVQAHILMKYKFLQCGTHN